MKKIIVVCGQTSTGKSDLAVELALLCDGEIISCDSRQIYKELDLLSGKITVAEMKKVPHYLLDAASLFDLPEKPMTVATFQKLAREKIKEISSRGKTPILCGGTGLYIDAVISNDYDFGNPKIDDSYLVHWIGLAIPMSDLRAKIYNRLNKRLEAGMLDEFENLLNSGIDHSVLEPLGLELRYASKYFKKELSYTEMRELLSIKIGQYAKRQMTWFKRNKNINWFTPTEYKSYQDLITAIKTNLDKIK